MRTTPWLERTAVLGFLVALTLLVLVPASPLFQKLPSWDSGVFLYTGWRVTLGELPYRDIWDHKPPLIFVLNALGLLLANGARWGVWVVEFVFMLAAAVLGFNLIRRAFGLLPAVYASVAWMVNAFVTMDGGNYTTEYALPLQFGLLLLIATARDAAITVPRAFVVGILSGLLFWLKQNDIGIPLAIVLLLVLDFLRGQRGGALRAFGAMLGGALLVSTLVVLPFVVQDALAQFWEAAFLYNFEYIEEPWFERLITLRVLPITLPALGMTTFAVVGWLIATLAFLNGLRGGGEVWTKWGDTLDRLWGERGGNTSRGLTRPQVVRLLTLVVIALPLECFFVALSGNTFDHYYLALLPVFSVLAAFSFQILLTVLERAALAPWVRVVFATALLVILVAFSADYVQSIFFRIVGRKQTALINHILKNTGARDTVLIWGGETRVNFEAQRANPTRFIYLGPLEPSEAESGLKRQELMSELNKHKPRLIIGLSRDPPPLSEFSTLEPEIALASRDFMSHYDIRATVDEWTVYEYRIP